MPSNLKLAEAAHQRGDFPTAKTLYSKVLQTDDENVDALYGLGTLEFQTNDLADALELLGRASSIEPQAPDIAFNYGLCLSKAGNTDKAISETLRAAKYCGTDESFSHAVCKLLMELNQPTAVLQQLAKFPHRQIESSILLAKARGALGDWDQAVSILRRLLNEQHDKPNIALELSVAAGKLRDYGLAIDSFQHYLKLSEPTAADHLRFADLYLIARDVDNSQKQLDQAASLGADGAEFHILTARLARLNADYELARNASESALAIQPDHGQAWSLRLEIAEYQELPDLIERINSNIDFSSIKPYHNSLIQFALADAHFRLDALSEAFCHYTTANELQKKNLRQRNTNYNFQTNSYQVDSTIKHFPKIFTQANRLPHQPTPIFILGMPRSGTTLVERMLSQLDNVTAGGENETLGFLATQYQRDANSKTLPLPESMSADQWQVFARRYHENTNHHSVNGGGKKADGTTGNLPDRFEVDFVTDKMPHNFNHVGMILSMFPNAKVIQMRRDPRDVCLSIYTKSFPDGHNYACSFDTLAHAYKLCDQLMDHWVHIAPNRVIDIHYEKLVEHPHSVGQKITAFCGLSWDEKCLDFHKNITSSFTFSEMQVRQAIDNRRVGRWEMAQEHLTPLLDALHRQGVLTGQA